MLVRLAAERAALPVLENLIEAQRRNDPVPEAVYLAQEIGAHAASNAEMIVTSGATSVQISQLIRRSTDQAEGTLKAKIAAVRKELAGLRDHQGEAANRKADGQNRDGKWEPNSSRSFSKSRTTSKTPH